MDANKNGNQESSTNILFLFFERLIAFNSCTIGLYSILILFEFIQLLYYPFKIGFTDNKSNFFAVFYKAMSYPNVESFLPSLSLPVIEAINGCLLGVAIVSIILFIINSIKENKKQLLFDYGKGQAKLISVLLPIFNCVVFKMIVVSYMTLFNCKAGKFVGKGNATCYNSTHIAIIIFSSLSLVFYILLSVATTLLFDDAYPKSRVPWASINGYKARFILIVLKLVCGAFEVLDSTGKYYLVYLIILTVATGFGIYLYTDNPAFYYRSVNVMVIGLNGFLFAWALAMLATRLNNSETYIEMIYGILLSIAVSIFLVMFKIKFDSYNLAKFASSMEDEKTCEHFYSIIFRQLEQLMKGTKQSHINLYGIIRQHMLSCSDTNQCFCKKCEIECGNKDQSASQSIIIDDPNRDIEQKKRMVIAAMFSVNLDEDEARLDESSDKNVDKCLHFFEYLLNEKIRENQRSVRLRVMSSYFEVHFMSNFFKAIYDSQYAQDLLKPGLKCRFDIFSIKCYISREIDRCIKNKRKAITINPEDFIKYETNFAILRNEVEGLSTNVNLFWQQIGTNSIDTTELTTLIDKVSSSCHKTESLNEICLKFKPNDVRLLTFMKEVQSEILCNEYETLEIERNLLAINTEVKTMNALDLLINDADSGSVLLIVSGNPGEIGKVIKCSDQVEALGVKAADIVGENINIITPYYIGERHNEMIEKFIERGTSNLLGKKRIISGIDSTGHLVPLRVIVQSLRNIENGMWFFAMARPLETGSFYFKEVSQMYSDAKFGYIATSVDGVIQGISAICSNEMGIPVFLFTSPNSDEITNISDIIQDLKEKAVEDQCNKEGKIVTIDTRGFRASMLNNDKISKADSDIIKKTGQYKIYLKIFKEAYGDNNMVKAVMYRFILLERAEASINESLDSDSIKNSTNKLIVIESPKSENQTPDNGKTEKIREIETNISTLNQEGEKRAKSVKKLFISSISYNITKIITILFTLAISLLIITSYIIFAILWSSKINREALTRMDFYMLQRIVSLQSLQMYTYLMNELITHDNYSPLLNNSDYYSLVSNFYGYSINSLKSSQESMNNEKNTPSVIKYLESGDSIDVNLVDTENATTHETHSINTAITQFIAKAVDYNSYSFTSRIANPDPSTYLFLMTNGLGNISQSLYFELYTFADYYQRKFGSMNYPQIGLSLSIIIASICIGIVIMIKILRAKKSKIGIITMFYQLTVEEAQHQEEQCLAYIKKYGYINEEKPEETDFIDAESTITRNIKGTATNFGNSESLDKFTHITPSKINSPHTPSCMDFGKENNKILTTPIEEIKEEKVEESEYYSEYENEEKKEDAVEDKKNEDESPDGSNNEDDEEEEEQRKKMILLNFKGKPKVEEDKRIPRISEAELISHLKVSKACTMISMAILVICSCLFYILIEAYYHSVKNNSVYQTYLSQNLTLQFIEPMNLISYTLEYINDRNYEMNATNAVSVLMTNTLNTQNHVNSLMMQLPVNQKVKTLFYSLNTNESCNIVNSNVSSYYNSSLIELYPSSKCNTFANEILLKGITNLLYSIHQEAFEIYNEKKLGVVFNISRLLNLTTAQATLIFPEYRIFYDLLSDYYQSSYKTEGKMLILFVCIYTMVMLMIRVSCWIPYIKSIDSDLLMSSGIASIMPEKFLIEILERKKTLK